MKNKITLLKVDPQTRRRPGYFGIFGTSCYFLLMAVFIAGCSKDVVNDQATVDSLNSAAISKTLPADLADTVAVNPVVAVTFKSAAVASDVSASAFSLKEGTTPVAGTVIISGNTATFTPAADLKPDTWFTATIKTTLKSGSLNDRNEHSWKFKTGKHRRGHMLSVASLVPAKSATSVAITVQPAVIFNQELTSSTSEFVTITLAQGTTNVEGTVSFSGKTATFKPVSSLLANTLYTGTVTFGSKEDGDDDDDDAEEEEEDDEDNDDADDDSDKNSKNSYNWSFTTGAGVGVVDVTAPVVSSVVPANNATAIAITSAPTVTFSEAMNSSTITATTFTLKQGTTVIAGTVTYAGTTATFKPAASLTANLVYTGTITTGVKDVAGNVLAANYTWSFTTAAGVIADVIAPTISSVVPANNATSVAITGKPVVTFSEAMTASTITSTTFTLKQGTTVVAGTVTYSGTTATFTPTSVLAGSTVYTGTITTGAKDVAGNAIAGNYTWSFTTAAVVVADVTPPTVLTVVPASGATSIALNSKVTASFSEAMTASTITSATFTVSQGTTAVAGTVTYSGTTATFTPSSALVAGKVYSATLTTGAKDAAGNAIAAAKTWSFTAVAAVAVTSWSTQVWPIIQSKCTTCHGTTGGSAGVNMGTYAQVSAMSNSAIDNSGMYSKGGVTAAEQTIIKAWIAQGKLNN